MAKSAACRTPREGPRPSSSLCSTPEGWRSRAPHGPPTAAMFQPLGDDLVVVDGVDRPHMLRGTTHTRYSAATLPSSPLRYDGMRTR
ncbi:hypothetical protein QFZ67_000154 [Streptomyces sp. V1I1]|nr:hypothetical protein [Streptomyces sp. V1I1]